MTTSSASVSKCRAWLEEPDRNSRFLAEMSSLWRCGSVMRPGEARNRHPIPPARLLLIYAGERYSPRRFVSAWGRDSGFNERQRKTEHVRRFVILALGIPNFGLCAGRHFTRRSPPLRSISASTCLTRIRRILLPTALGNCSPKAATSESRVYGRS